MGEKTAYFGVFAALAIIFGYIEAIFPFYVGIQGVKLGIANLVIVIVLYKSVLATNPINIPMLLNITTLAVADCCSSFEKWPV